MMARVNRKRLEAAKRVVDRIALQIDDLGDRPLTLGRLSLTSPRKYDRALVP